MIKNVTQITTIIPLLHNKSHYLLTYPTTQPKYVTQLKVRTYNWWCYTYDTNSSIPYPSCKLLFELSAWSFWTLLSLSLLCDIQNSINKILWIGRVRLPNPEKDCLFTEKTFVRSSVKFASHICTTGRDHKILYFHFIPGPTSGILSIPRHPWYTNTFILSLIQVVTA